MVNVGLTEADKTDARRFMGYPAYGAAVGAHSGWWFYQDSAAVDVRLAGLSDSETAVLHTYLRTLRGLEAAIPEVGAGLDTSSAGGWVRNSQELDERDRLFDNWRRRMCGFLGVQPGPDLRRGGGSVQLVI